MTDRRLTPQQRTAVLADIASAGFDPQRFCWVDVPRIDTQYSRLEYRAVSAFFEFRWFTQAGFTGFTVRSWPRLRRAPYAGREWGPMLVALREWLAHLHTTPPPDLQQLADIRHALFGHQPGPEHPMDGFSPIERVHVAQHLATLATFAIESFELDDQQARVLVEHLDYLDDATGRVNLYEWQELAATTLGEVVTDLTLTTYQAGVLLQFATQLLGPVRECTVAPEPAPRMRPVEYPPLPPGHRR